MDQSPLDITELEIFRGLLDRYNVSSRARGFPVIAAKGDSVLNFVIDDIETSRASVVVSIEDHRRGLRLVPEPVRAVR